MIIPGILEKDFKDIQSKVLSLVDTAESIQIDVADNVIVNGLSFLDIDKLADLKTTSKIEIHLMVKKPSEYLHEKISNVDKICAQVEALEDIPNFLVKAKNLGYKVGLSIEPESDLMVLNDYLDDIDYLQFMCTEPGAQGRKFVYAVISKIRGFINRYPRLKVQVDGGITESTLPLLQEAGVNTFVVGSAIFSSSNPKETFLKYSNMLDDKKTSTVSSIIPATIHESIKQVAFLGGAAWKENEEPYIQAYETAKLLAAHGYGIVDGGGPGVMEAATKGAHASGKQVLAVTYHPNKPKRHYEGTTAENEFDIEVITLDYFDRTKVMLQTTQAHIVFKGSLGTLSEFGMSWISSWIHEPDNKPIILYGEFWQDFLDVIHKHMLIEHGEENLLKICTTPQQVLDFLDSFKK